MDEIKTTSRRQWLRGSVRWGLLAAMSAAAGNLLGRKSGNKEMSCADPDGRLSCRDCAQLRGCGLPRALSVKHYLKKDHGTTNS